MINQKISNILFILFAAVLLLACATQEDKKGRFLLKGNEKLKENDLKGALDFYTEALKIDPNFADALLNRGIVQSRLNNFEAAIDDFSNILSIGSSIDSTAYFQRGLSYLDNGENYKALNDAENLLKESPESWKSYFLLGLTKERLKDYDAALKAFEKGLSYNPTNADLIVNMATILYYQKDYNRAIELLENAEKSNPEEANIYNLRSMIAFDNDRYQEALSWVEKAISINPRVSFYHNNRGLYYLFLGELDKGITDINFSIKQNSKNPYAWRNKGIYYFLTGDKVSAQKYLEDAKNYDPKMDLVDEYLSKIRAL
ncbi:tetratricopeptide repeat protein [Belliella kenyensis]|uniref:Tetratricopeptide repeat protein n=1 Tax=Belliella kenyensis TaxID=1472724 RepID=A0ABV8EMU3_9BACT|nr:tetratricopeptide repeat protein [Belliella kenyensis]MCH7402988.1 tetratricopeptide repeat protein [Belliella kenyensis]MDN3605024.1 tetratricopeptide repeat protein [Belliella kenyensis]